MAAKKVTDTPIETETAEAPFEVPTKPDTIHMTYTRPLGSSDERDLVVGINGRVTTIKQDEPVDIRRPVYEVLQHAAKQDRAARDLIRQAEADASSSVPFSSL